MVDFLLENNRNSFRRNGNMFALTDSSDYLEQKIRATLSIQLGEFFADSSIGVPYIPDFNSTKNDYRELLLSVIQVKVMQIAGIKKLLNFEATVDNKTRRIAITFTVTTIDDTEVKHTQEFIV